MSETLASIVVLIKPINSSEWQEYSHYRLSSSVVQIGRARKCQINLTLADSLVSRVHATMYKYDENEDYMIQDGQPGVSTISDPDPGHIPSSIGTMVNGQYLTYTIKETGEEIESRIAKDLGLVLQANKRLLRDKDEITIVPNLVKLVYIRATKRVSEDLDQTVIPDEYRTE